jgi:hypothetical protein
VVEEVSVGDVLAVVMEMAVDDELLQHQQREEEGEAPKEASKSGWRCELTKEEECGDGALDLGEVHCPSQATRVEP